MDWLGEKAWVENRSGLGCEEEVGRGGRGGGWGDDGLLDGFVGVCGTNGRNVELGLMDLIAIGGWGRDRVGSRWCEWCRRLFSCLINTRIADWYWDKLLV